MKQLERLWPHPQSIETSGHFSTPTKLCLGGTDVPGHLLNDVNRNKDFAVSRDNDAYLLYLSREESNLRPEGYRLTMDASGCRILAADETGLSYGLQTFLQISALCREGLWPELGIADWPTYRKRCFMADMGRSAYNMPMLKRLVRILHRLKMNQLHLHLYDDELCGIRFEGLPFGQDNPYAISLGEFAELVRYAQTYHVEVVPELEGWGHVGSLVFHRKELRGGEGMYHGSSFLICEETFSLMKRLISGIAEGMPDKGTVHLGLDEATWVLGSDMPSGFSPADLVERYYDILQTVGKEHGKSLTMRIWADHAGRPVPEHIQRDIIIEPWNYWAANYAAIDQAVETYTANRKMRWMAGAGTSGAQHRGSYHATRYWARQARESGNIDGINITFWCSNDIRQRFISLFAGAYFIWNPSAPTEFAEMEDYENFDRLVFPIMHWWQSTFRDAYPDEIERDSCPLVNFGFYIWGSKHGQPVAPAVVPANTWQGHDFVNE